MKRSHLLSLAIAVLVLLSAPVTHADTELSLYTGKTSISDTDLNVYYFASGLARVRENFDASSLIGARLTRWGDQLDWLGVAFDLSSFTGRSRDMELRVMPLSLLLMLRLSFLRSEEFPRGTLHPYLGIGPSLIYYRYTLDARPAVTEPLSVSSLGTAWPVSAGVTWQFSKHVGLRGIQVHEVLHR